MYSCCNSHNNPNGNNIDYKKCLEILTNQEDLTGFLQTLANALGISINDKDQAEEKPKVQCVIVPALSLCQEINLFNLDSKILESMIICTFVSLFQNLSIDFFQRKYKQYEQFFKADPALEFANFSRLSKKELKRLHGIYRSFEKKPKDFYDFLTSKEELTKLGNCVESIEKSYQLIIAYITKVTFLEELAVNFTKAEFSSCQRFLRIETDLVIIMNRLTELATNTAGGISGIGEALVRVGLGDAARYFDSNDFNDLFDALDETADVIQLLAKLYRQRLKVFAKVGDNLVCSRPQPPVLSPIAEIPTVPPTVIV